MYQLQKNNIPCFFIGKDNGNSLMVPGLRINIFANNENTEVETNNLIFESVLGNPNDIVVIGAHSDGVEEGPGNNDNGSGTSTILEIALQLAINNIRPIQKVKFAFWAAEEMGLLGSYHYVRSLTNEEASKIVLNLNFDMLGSPNYKRAIYYGGAETVDPRIRRQSGNIQKVFELHYNNLGLEFDLTPFDGRSDYGPFIERFIPAGGLATGAEKIKTEEQRRKFGGFAGMAFDPCYHKNCDDFGNIHRLGIHEMAQAAAFTTHYLSTIQNIRTFLQRPLNNERIVLPKDFNVPERSDKFLKL